MLDVVIIGSGPAGITAAIYAKRANLNVAVVEKEYLGTGQIAESSRVDNYPGIPGIDGYSLGEKFRETCRKSRRRIHGSTGFVFRAKRRDMDNRL